MKRICLWLAIVFMISAIICFGFGIWFASQRLLLLGVYQWFLFHVANKADTAVAAKIEEIKKRQAQ